MCRGLHVGLILMVGFVCGSHPLFNLAAADPKKGNPTESSRAGSVSEGLLGHWKFDAGEGDIVVDHSGRENDGEIWGAEWVRGKFGTALRFNSQGAHVAIPELGGLDGSDEMTVEAWVFWEGSGRYPNILTGGTWSPGGFLLFVSDNQCTFRMGRPGFSATHDRQQWREVAAPLVSPFAPSRWYHLAATFRRPEIKTYVNGQEVGKARWDEPVGYQGDLIVGKWAGATSHKGLIDEVKIHGRALDADQIAASYRSEAGTRAAPAPTEPAYKSIPRASQLATAVATFDNEFAKLAISSRGRLTALLDSRLGEDLIPRTSPFVSIRQDGKTYQRATCSLEEGKLVFRFAKARAEVVVDVVAKPHYFVLRVESVKGPNVEQVTFARLNLKSCEHVSATSGLAAGEQFGVCLRALNLPTRVDVRGNPPVLTAISYAEHGLEEGRAALVACPTSQMLPVLQELVRAEKIPHSPLGGPFAQAAPENRGSYVFARVSSKSVDAWIDLARRGGIQTVHLSGWQQSLGHYEPNKSLFPEGIEGLKAVVDKLHAAGLKVGIHTLTGCIDTNDPWVRPVPDRRLATDGTYTLAADLGAEATTLPTAEPPGDHPTVWAYSSRGNCLRIDDELIHYSAIATEAPFGFSGCRRGAFGTKVAPHAKGAPVHHMFARYGCFVPEENSTLVDEVAKRIADVYNTCGLDQIYMDGAEAMQSWYGIARVRQAIFTRLKGNALVEASCWNHHSWPFHSRIGAWDHPKWGLKRFADDHLAAVDHYRKAALLEAQLGWWVLLGPGRDWDLEMPDEIEYLCAKALGHDVPLSFQSVAAVGSPSNARQAEYLTTIGRYERLRLANYFSEAVRQKLREQRQEFRLTQNDQGHWQLLPTDYLKHKVTLEPGAGSSGTWTVTNRFASQPIGLRIQALYSAYPYDDEKNLVLTDFSADREFSATHSASGVVSTMRTTTGPDKPWTDRKEDAPLGQFTATNRGDTLLGAWTRTVKQFDPVVDMTPYDAIGLWVHGDGGGQLLNLQLTNLPDYFRTLDDHYVKVDFQGWRYFELLLRERDAAAYHDYRWPYGAHCVLHRSPLVRHAVNKMTLYLNHLPPRQEATCRLGPVKALRTRKVVLENPAITWEGGRLVFPVALESGMFIEYHSADDCRLYDERGRLLEYVKPKGDIPALAPGDNRLTFTCEGTEGFRSRAEVTVVTSGPPLDDRAPDERIEKSLLAREYEAPRTILAIDGRQNEWDVLCRPEVERADVGMELDVDQVAGPMAMYDARSAITLEGFERQGAPSETTKPRAVSYSYDSDFTATGCSPGVTQKLTRSEEVVKFGRMSGFYTATSSRADRAGWSFKGGRLSQSADLSRFASIGFWLHGDAGGQQFKLQLHDAQGGWQDMVTRVNFNGWRFRRFALGGPKLKDPSRITAVNVYFNGLPAGKTVACYVDEIRALLPPEPLRNPSLTVGGNPIEFPVAMHSGDRLVLKPRGHCRLFRRSGEVEEVALSGLPPRLSSGRNRVLFSVSNARPDEFRITVSLTKHYP